MMQNYGIDEEAMAQITKAIQKIGREILDASEKIGKAFSDVLKPLFASGEWQSLLSEWSDFFEKKRPQRKLTILHRNTVKKLIGHLPDYRRNMGS